MFQAPANATVADDTESLVKTLDRALEAAAQKKKTDAARKDGDIPRSADRRSRRAGRRSRRAQARRVMTSTLILACRESQPTDAEKKAAVADGADQQPGRRQAEQGRGGQAGQPVPARRSWPTSSKTARRTSAKTRRRSSSSTGRTSRTTATSAGRSRRKARRRPTSSWCGSGSSAGGLTADQYLACDQLAQTIGNGTLRITTRQEFQLHGVLKDDLKTTIRRINESLLSTLAACGDVERNVLCCPAPIHDPLRERRECRRRALGVALRPAVDAATGISGSTARRSRRCRRPGESLVPTAGDDPVEPIYGKTYLPRKFKTAFALPEDNCTDIHANDLGFLAIVEDGELVGYNVLVGGGLGTTPSAQKTFPFLAVPLCYVDRGDVLEIGEAVLKVFRDFGNRSDRKRARLKYIIHDWGLPAFRAKVEEYLGQPLADPEAGAGRRRRRPPRLARAG